MSRRVRTQTGKTNRSHLAGSSTSSINASAAARGPPPRSRLAAAAKQGLQSPSSATSSQRRGVTIRISPRSAAARQQQATSKRTQQAHALQPPNIYNEQDAEAFVKVSLSRAQKFKNQATKRRVFRQVREYMKGRGKGTMAELFSAMQSHQHGGGKAGGISCEEFRSFIKRTALGPTIANSDIDVAFELADRDGSGVIDHDEFLDVFAPEQLAKSPPARSLDLTNAERLQVNHELDALRLKVLNKLGAAGKKDGEAGGVGRALWKAYEAMDLNGDGCLTYAEFKKALGPEGFNLNLSHSEQNDLAVACDLNFDGTISPEEFAFTLMEAHYPDVKHYFQDEREDLIHKLKKSVDAHADEFAKHRQYQLDREKQNNKFGSAQERAAAAAAAAAERKARTGNASSSPTRSSNTPQRFRGIPPEQLRKLYFVEKMRSGEEAKVQHRGYEYNFNHRSSFDIAPRSSRGSSAGDPFATTNDIDYVTPAAAKIHKKLQAKPSRRTTDKYSSTSQRAFDERALDPDDPANRRRHTAPTTVVGIAPGRLAGRLMRQEAYQQQHAANLKKREDDAFRRDKGRLNSLRFQRQKYLEKLQGTEKYYAAREHHVGKHISQAPVAVANRNRSSDAKGPLW